MRIALAQINTMAGGIKENTAKIIDYIEQAKKTSCDMIVFPELSVTGYPAGDLLLRSDFIRQSQEAIEEILPHTRGIAALVGNVTPVPVSGRLRNSAILLENGRIAGRADKTLLSDYDEFDETRYFDTSDGVRCLYFNEMKLGVSIGNEILDSRAVSKDDYVINVLDDLYYESPDIFINMSAVPYQYGGLKKRAALLTRRMQKYDNITFVSVNQVGGNDQLIFGGCSMVFNGEGRPVLFGKDFEEELIVYDTRQRFQEIELPKEDISWVYRALVLGVRDYFRKSGFKKTLLGLSGGIDSALVACIAVDALGSENVLGVSMPSRYSSEHSKDDARVLAENLGIEYRVLPIEDVFKQYIRLFNGNDETIGDLAEENIQARIRGNLLMFISNRESRMLISTGNKSEIAAGYSTLYGDMCGSLAVIGDVPKTMVYKICSYINRDRIIIPESTLTKPPSAELRPNQVDQDSLPPYDVLDAVVEMYMDEGMSASQIAEKGYDKDTVVRILNMIDRMEYKRHQAAPLLKVTSRPIGKGRKIPLTHGFRWE